MAGNYSLQDWLQKDITPEAKLVGIGLVRASHAIGSIVLSVEDVAEQLRMTEEEVRQEVWYKLDAVDFASVTEDGLSIRLRQGLPWMMMLDRPGADWAATYNAIRDPEVQEPGGQPASLTPASKDPAPEGPAEVMAAEGAPTTKSGKRAAMVKQTPEEPTPQEPGDNPKDWRGSDDLEDRVEAGAMRIYTAAHQLDIKPATLLKGILDHKPEGVFKDNLTVSNVIQDGQALLDFGLWLKVQTGEAASEDEEHQEDTDGVG